MIIFCMCGQKKMGVSLHSVAYLFIMMLSCTVSSRYITVQGWWLGLLCPFLHSDIFPVYPNYQTLVTYWISCLYLTYIATAKWCLWNMNVVKKNDRYFCKNGNFHKGEIKESLTHWGRVTHIYASVNKPASVQIMACRLDGAKPLSEPMLEYY